MRVLLVSDENAKSILWCAAAGGHTVDVVGVPSRNRLIQNHPKCHTFHALPDDTDFLDMSPEIAAKIGNIARSIDADVVCPSSFESIQFFSTFKDTIGRDSAVVPTASLDVIQRLDHKNRFYEFCVENSINHPDSVLVSAGKMIDRTAVEVLKLPVITKPVLGAGEAGIVKFDDWERLRQYVEALDPAEGDLLIQEWFAGTDIDFNGFALNGTVIAGSVMQTRYVESRHRVTLTDFVIDDAVSRLGRAIVSSSRYTGPLNIDMRRRDDDGEIMAIEVNPRFWDRIVISLIDKMNFVDVGIRSALGDYREIHSATNGSVWASSIRDLVHAAIRGDAVARRALPNLTALQVRFALTNKIAGRHSG